MATKRLVFTYPIYRLPKSHTRIVVKEKEDLIHKSKLKKAYAKIKAKEADSAPVRGRATTSTDQSRPGKNGDEKPESEEKMHPARQLMIIDEDMAQAGTSKGIDAGAEDDDQDANEATGADRGDGSRRRTRRPGYYDKQLDKAAQAKDEAAERQRERQRRNEERMQKTAEREKFKRAMAKTVDRDGRKKLGRESGLLLDKVRKLVANGSSRA